MEHKASHDGYPMIFQHTVSNDEITIDLCNRNCSIGDIFNMPVIPKFKVLDILEEREPAIKSDKNPNNKNHHPIGAKFFKLKGKILPN